MDAPASPFARIARRITWIAWMLLACAAITFAWAIGFTKGVEALVNVLLISLLGFLVPSLFVFWVAWVIGDRAPEDAEEATVVESARPLSRDRSVWLRYAFAVAASALAVLARAMLLPVLGYTQPYPTFYLAVAASAWYGGMGPALLTNALSLVAVWIWFVPPTWSLSIARIGDIVGLGLFFAVSITVAAMASSLRAVRHSPAALSPEIHARQVALEAAASRFRAIADQAPVPMWMIGADGECFYANPAAAELSGRSVERLLGRGWIACLDADDVERVRGTFAQLPAARERIETALRIRGADGVVRSVDVEARRRFDAAKRFEGWIVCAAATADERPDALA
jgi:PAS domain S-box-containing protein